jgi:hypothetical protein
MTNINGISAENGWLMAGVMAKRSWQLWRINVSMAVARNGFTCG